MLDPPSGEGSGHRANRQRGVQQPLPSQAGNYHNLEDGLTATVAPIYDHIDVIGNEQEIEALSSESLKVQVDVTGSRSRNVSNRADGDSAIEYGMDWYRAVDDRDDHGDWRGSRLRRHPEQRRMATLSVTSRGLS